MVAGRFVDPEDAFSQLANVVIDDSAEMPEEADMEGNAVPTTYDFSNAIYDPKRVEEEIREMLQRASVSEASFENNYEE